VAPASRGRECQEGWVRLRRRVHFDHLLAWAALVLAGAGTRITYYDATTVIVDVAGWLG
jgi:hypothetical protein